LDYLVKKNIIKKNKVIIDVGSKYIKLLGVHYANKKITITNAQKIDSSLFFNDNELNNVGELVRNVDRIMSKNKNSEISLSIPTNIVNCKIVSVKNKKVAELGKYIEREHTTFSKVSPLTHIIDYTYLGSREENGDSIHYCLVAAVSKNSVNLILDEFNKRKLKVSTISYPIYDLINLSELYHGDFENMNRLMIDFGVCGTRVVAFYEGVAVYVRDINIGVNTYLEKLFECQESLGKPEIFKLLSAVGEMKILTMENLKKLFSSMNKEAYFNIVNEVSSQLAKDIFRIVEMCENNNAAITKIICGGFMIKGFDERLKQNGDMEVEMFDLNLLENVSGRDFIVQIGNAHVDSTFNNAIGLAINTFM